MKRTILVTLWFAFAVMTGYSSRVYAGTIQLVRNTVVFSNKSIAPASDTTFNVPVTLTEEGSVVTPSKYSERPKWILWEFLGRQAAACSDSAYRATVRLLVNGKPYNITNPGSLQDSLMVVQPYSATENYARGFAVLTPSLADTFSIRITNPHPVVAVDSLTVSWRWIRVY